MKKIIWLGQGGWFIDFGNATLMLDPYLSDSVAKVNPKNYRRVPVCEEYLHYHPDYLCITHDHLDHLDPETIPHILNTKAPITVFAPYNAWCEIRKQGGAHNYVLLDNGSSWSEPEFKIQAVKAAHSDLTAVGYIISHEEKTYYFSGDTVYNDSVVSDVKKICPGGVDYAFIPINGVGNNTNTVDAARLAEDVGAKCAVPVHFGMFDELSPENFRYPCRIIPEIYKEININ